MSEVATTEVPMRRYFLGMPHEILLEIFRRLPKGKLFEISKLCSKFGDVAGDKRLWKNVYIKYQSNGDPMNGAFAFKELYSGPYPVKVVDLSFTNVKPAVSLETDQIVRIRKLDLSGIKADKLTIEAVLAKYQFTELHLNFSPIDCHGHVMGIAPEAFSNRTALEVLSIRGLQNKFYDIETESEFCQVFFKWLAVVLNKYCRNLKTLDLSYNHSFDSYMLPLVQYLPTSLEKLCLVGGYCSKPGNFFFEWLARRLPNLKELELCPARVKYPSLLEFKWLEALHVIPYPSQDIRDLYMYLIRFPALKTVYIDIDRHYCSEARAETNLETLRATLKLHGITTVRITEHLRTEHPMNDNNFWSIKKTL